MIEKMSNTSPEKTNLLTAEKLAPLRSQLNKVLVGKADVVELVIVCLISKGHLLFDDLPGLGKTTLAKALTCLLYTSPSPRDRQKSRMPSSA